MNKQEEVIKLCREKGFPLDNDPDTIEFLVSRIGEEYLEVMNAYYQDDNENLKEELIDVTIQCLQLLYVVGGDFNEEFRKKMDKNFKREWTNV